MFRDFRYAFRVLASRPVFGLVAALSLGLGIGANSAIFGLVDALWFRPLAVPHSSDIVRIYSVTDQDREAAFSYPEYLDLENARTLREVVAIGGRGASDGIRTRVYGFAGRCLAAQPHPHKTSPCQLRRWRSSISLDSIISARGRFDDAARRRGSRSPTGA